MGDLAKLNQILTNLVGNALKFSHQGTISVSVERAAATDNWLMLHFCVADQGIGIPPEAQQRIFETFEQADATTTKRYGGTGLGLAICQRLAGLMQGDIWVESQPDVGSRFFFTACFHPAADDVQIAAEQSPNSSASRRTSAAVRLAGTAGR